MTIKIYNDKGAKNKACKRGLKTDHLRDLIVLELMDWFKRDFFVWLDDVVCKKCNGVLSPAPSEAASSMEYLRGADYVEA